MSARAEELAQRFAQESAAFTTFVAAIPAAQWEQIIGDGELRSVGLVAYHVVEGYAIHQRHFGAIAAGQPLPPLTPADGDTLTAALARERAGIAQAEVVQALRAAGATAADWIRGLSDEQLDRRGEYLVGIPAWTVEKWVTRGLIGHHTQHLQDIRAALHH